MWRGPVVAGEVIDLANVWRTYHVARVVRRWLQRAPHRIFHGHSRAGLLVALWLDFLGARRVVVSVHCHARTLWFYRWAKRRLGPRLQWLTPAMKAHYRVAGGGWEDCTPNALPGEPEPLRRWPSGRELRLGAAGFIAPVKRWEILVDAMAQLPAEAPVRLRHVGAEFRSDEALAYSAGLRAKAKALAAVGRIEWLEWRTNLVGFLREIDVLVVPSELESFSLVALEALSVGVPVIAARGSGTEHLVCEGVSGWIFAPGDSGALACLMRDLLVPTAWSRVGGVAPGIERFQMEAIAMRWERLYREL